MDGLTKKYVLTQLVYFETYQYINDAIKREKKHQKMEATMENQLNPKRQPKLDRYIKRLE